MSGIRSVLPYHWTLPTTASLYRAVLMSLHRAQFICNDDLFVSMLTEAALAHTYSHPSYADPMDVVADYERVREWASHHPDAGSTAAANALDLPRGRIRPWLDATKPDVVRALETARELDWFNVAVTNERGRAFGVLTAAVLSGGSITQATFRPRFTVSNLVVTERVTEALEVLGCESQRVAENAAGRATELEPTKHGALLGRALVALGLPTGSKVNSEISLPAFLEGAPQSLRRTWVETYLANRGTELRQKDSLTVQEKRSEEYLTGLAKLIEDVGRGRVSVGERGLIVSAEAARSLGFGRDGDFRSST